MVELLENDDPEGYMFTQILVPTVVFQVFDICKNADPKDEKALKLAEKLGVKLTTEEKDYAGKQLLKVRTYNIFLHALLNSRELLGYRVQYGSAGV